MYDSLRYDKRRVLYNSYTAANDGFKRCCCGECSPDSSATALILYNRESLSITLVVVGI